jgi:hypothetical protein
MEALGLQFNVYSSTYLFVNLLDLFILMSPEAVSKTVPLSSGMWVKYRQKDK